MLKRSGLGQIWQRLQARLQQQPIATAGMLRSFVEDRASLIAQKCAFDYCRGKTGLASYALFTEKPFLDAFEVCRWETFVVVLGDLLILAEGCLRPHAAAVQWTTLSEALIGLYAEVLTSMPAPAHRASGWGDAIASFRAHLAVVGQNEPPGTLALADHSARRLFETLPIHISMRALDEEVVYGAVRFRMVAVNQEMRRRLNAVSVVNEVLGSSVK